MAITNASTLAEYAAGISTQGATLTVDANNKRVGIGTTNPQAMLQVGTGVTVFGNAGIASFTSLKLSGETDSTSTTTGALTVTGGVGIGLSLTVGGDVSVGGTITYEDVTNVDSLGIVTARSGLRVVGGGVTCVGVATFFNNIRAEDGVRIVGGGVTCVGVATFFDDININGAPPWTVTGSSYGNLSISGINAATAGFLNLGNGAAATNADFDLTRIKIFNGATEVSRITATTATGANDDADLHFSTKATGGALTTRMTIEDGGRVLIGESGTAGSTQRLIVGNGGAENFEFTPASSSLNGGVLEYIHRGDTATRPDLSMYVSGAFKIYTNGSNERMRVTQAGLVAIGTTIEGHSNADDLTIATSGNTGISIRSGSSSTGNIFFSDATSSTGEYEGMIFYDHSDNSMALATAQNTKLTITSTGDVTIRSIEAGATGPTLKLTHDSASPADNDIIGVISMDGDDDAGNATEFSSIYTKVTDVSNSTETAHIGFKTRALNSFNEIFRLAARGTASAPSYTTDDHNGIILDVYNTGNPYPRYMNIIAKSAGDTDSNIAFWTEKVGGSPTEKVRIDASGRLLVGATSSSYAYSSVVIEGNATFTGGTGTLQLQGGFTNPSSQGSGLGEIRFTDANEACGAVIKVESDAAWSNGSSYPSYLSLKTTAASATSSTERVRIDSAGRMGLGVVPKTWHSNNKAVIQGNGGYSILGRSNNLLGIYQNFYYDSSDAGKYLETGEASAYFQDDGNHRFYNAVSGTGDASCSLVERLRITTDGTFHINSADSASGGRLYAGSSAMYIQSGNGRQTFKVSDAASGVNRTWEITTDGNLKAPDTKGIDFSATSNQSGVVTGGEILTDYEVGTYTPECLAHNGSAWVSATLDAGTFYGSYCKVGNVCHVQVYGSNFHLNSAHDGQLAGFTLPMYADAGNTGYSVLCVNHEQCFASAGQTNLFIATNTGRALSIQEHTTSYNTWSGSSGRYIMFAGTYRPG